MNIKRAGLLTRVVIAALLIYMVLSVLDLERKIQTVEAQQTVLARQVDDQRQENKELELAIANSDDAEMLEQVARDRGYVKENETLFVDVAN